MRHTGARRHAPYGAEFVIVQMTIGKQPGTKQKKTNSSQLRSSSAAMDWL